MNRTARKAHSLKPQGTEQPVPGGSEDPKCYSELGGAVTGEFRSERELVDVLLDFLSSGTSPWPLSRTKTEFEYTNGRTDVIGLMGVDTVIALEAKLTKWREALQQAYRNTCFAHQSLVVLPWKVAQRASAYRQEFERRRVGLCGVGPEGVVVLIEPCGVEPILPTLTSKALANLEH